MITLIDYGMGNLFSVQKAFEKLGESVVISSNPEDIKSAEILVLPGVGSFGAAMENLQARGLVEVLRLMIKKKPFLGICLGFHLLFEFSEESPGVAGLGIFEGCVKKFTDSSLPIPHMGWNRENHFNHYVYFVHSYFAVPIDHSLSFSTTDYGEQFCSAIQWGKGMAVQYHPEKSGDQGLDILRYFLETTRCS